MEVKGLSRAGWYQDVNFNLRCGEVLGCSGKAVSQSPPELAFDLDHLADYRYAAGGGSAR